MLFAFRRQHHSGQLMVAIWRRRRARSSTPPSGGARCARIRRLTRAQSARVELAARARRAAFERPRGRPRRARIPARPGASGRSALAPRERRASARSTCAFCAGRQRRLHFDLLFARQLPAHVHRTIFFTRDDGRVVVQLPNYPAIIPIKKQGPMDLGG